MGRRGGRKEGCALQSPLAVDGRRKPLEWLKRPGRVGEEEGKGEEEGRGRRGRGAREAQRTTAFQHRPSHQQEPPILGSPPHRQTEWVLGEQGMRR